MGTLHPDPDRRPHAQWDRMWVSLHLHGGSILTGRLHVRAPEGTDVFELRLNDDRFERILVPWAGIRHVTDAADRPEHGRDSQLADHRPRRLVQRSNDRHQWEKNRVKADLHERSSTGATEYDTGLDVRTLDFSAWYTRIEAGPGLAAALGAEPGEPLLKRTYRTRHQDERAPMSIVHSYMPLRLIEANPHLLDEANEPWPGGTQNQLHTVGIEIDRIVERVTARPPTVEETEELDLTLGTAVMVIQKSSIDLHDRVADWSEIILPGDRAVSRFTTQLERWQT